MSINSHVKNFFSPPKYSFLHDILYKTKMTANVPTLNRDYINKTTTTTTKQTNKQQQQQKKRGGGGGGNQTNHQQQKGEKETQTTTLKPNQKN